MAEDMIAATKRELERWPGATVSFANGGKHITATLGFQGRTRMVVCASTLSDNSRGGKNHIAQVRRELLSLGAARIATPKSTAPKRQRNKPARPMQVDLAPIAENPFAKLAGLVVPDAPEPRQSLLQRALAAIRRLFA